MLLSIIPSFYIDREVVDIIKSKANTLKKRFYLKVEADLIDIVNTAF